MRKLLKALAPFALTFAVSFLVGIAIFRYGNWASAQHSTYDPTTKTLVVATFVMSVNGAVVDAKALDVYPSIKDCVDDIIDRMHKAGPVPPGAHVAVVCADTRTAHESVVQADGPPLPDEPKPAAGQTQL